MASYKPHDQNHRDMQEDVRPPNSRLFVICGKGITEETFRNAFERYGKVEDIWVVKDRRTNEDKGVAYIKFSKASEAALAMDEMNGKHLEGNNKPIKVLIASSKREGSVRDPQEDEKFIRLFVIVPKTFTKDDLRKEFEEYGEVDNVSLVTDRGSGESKGFGYVRFHKAYHAAMALENCDPAFKPKFADPKPRKDRDEFDLVGGMGRFDRGMHGGSGGGGGGGGYQSGYRDIGRARGLKREFDAGHSSRSHRQDDFIGMMGGGSAVPSGYFNDNTSMASGNIGLAQGPMELLQTYQHQNITRLHITAPIGLTQGYLTRLFSLIPGLEYCDLNETTGVAYARYTTPQCAAYAKDKLDGFEYPIGSRLMVRFADGSNPSGPEPMQQGNMGFDSYRGYMSSTPEDDTMQRAALILEKAGINPDRVMNAAMSGHHGGMERVPYTSIMLPSPRPMLPDDTEVCQRLFIVCQPSGIPEKVLRDAFCRFGNLIDVYLLPARNYGYAKFATKDAAMQAIQVLHGQNLAGNRLKVLEAEPPKQGDLDDGSKRPRY